MRSRTVTNDDLRHADVRGIREATSVESDRDVERLLDIALTLPVGDRGSFLRVCEDGRLKERLEQLLALAECSDGFLDRPPLRRLAARAAATAALRGSRPPV